MKALLWLAVGASLTGRGEGALAALSGAGAPSGALTQASGLPANEAPEAAESIGAEGILYTASLAARDAGTAPQVGTPILWRIAVDHPSHSGASLDVPSDLGLSWSLIEELRNGPVAGSADGDGEAQDLVFEALLMPLEGGELSVPAVTVRFQSGFELPIAPKTIRVMGSLAESEDAARPAPGFRQVKDRSVGDPRTVLVALLALLLLPLGWVIVRRRRRRGAAQAPENGRRTPGQAVAALDPAADPRGVMAALTPHVRRAMESLRGESRSALTDSEWAEWMRQAEGVHSALRSDAADLVDELVEVRFGGGDPTVFAAKEAHTKALLLVQRVEGESSPSSGAGHGPDPDLAAGSNSGSVPGLALGPIFMLQEAARSTAEERFEVFGVGFADPWFLALIPVATFLLWRGREKKRSAAARVPTIGGQGVAVQEGPLRRLVGAMPAILRIAAAAAILVALSRPLEGRVEAPTETEGIDIALLMDRSSSMDQRGRPSEPRRFDIVKKVVTDFAARRMTDEVGARDSVALLGFAGFTDLLVPFTLDVKAMESVLEDVDVETERWLDGTAIGRAMAQAIDMLRGSKAKSRIIVLLTDGEQNSPGIQPMSAAKVAEELGIRVYTVFAGPKEFATRTLFGDIRRQKVDVGELPDIAEITGGRFFHAENEAELEDAYAAIEDLERTPREEETFAERYDLYPRWLLPALVLYALSVLLGATISRRIP